jgi:ferredoxin/flavodoxin---NADP+ reductase
VAFAVTESEKYTAERITWLHAWAPNLFSFRLTRHRGFRFVPGQFARLGVTKADGRIAWRAYSMVSADYDEHLEFFSIVVPGGEFTSELASLRVGDTVLVEKASFGFLTLDRFEGGRDLWMLATGTGLAPFVSILFDPRTWERFERLIVVHSVRYANELAYAETLDDLRRHELFAPMASKLTCVAAITRGELQPGITTPAPTLRARIPAALADGSLERTAGVRLDPQRARIMICGNPEMVDATRKQLAAMGYVTSRRVAPGHVAVENYW